MGQFSLIDLIHAVLQKTGPARLIVATWSAGIKDAHQVRWLADTELITDFKLLTDHSYAARQGKYAASIEELFGKENIRTSEMHAKFVLIENDDFKVSIMSSMNLNANKTCELFEVEEGADVFDMLMNFACHHFDDMQPGFVKSATKVSQTVARFFEKHAQKDDAFDTDFNFSWE